MITILSIACVVFWTVGAALTVIITGWEVNKVNELIKIVFWPITIFIKK